MTAASGRFLDADAWVIATPYDWHLAWAKQAVQCNRHFFVEKPLGSLEQIPQWRALVKQAKGVITQVGYQCRWQAEAQKLHALLPRATGGTFGCAVDMRTWPGSSYGDPLLECSHEIDLALWCGAPPNVTSARLADHAYIIELGKTWTIATNTRSGDYKRAWSVWNDKTTLEPPPFRSALELGDEMYRAELAHFLDCVRTGQETACPLRHGARVLEVCQQAMALAKTTA